MTTSAVTKRLAASGLATALAAGAVVTGTATSAEAAVSGGATFSCTVPVLGAVDVPLTLSADDLPTDVLADLEVPAGLPVVGELQVGGLLGLLGLVPGLTDLGAGLPGFGLLLGDVPVPVDLAAPVAPVSSVVGLGGNLDSFTTPARAGTYDVTLPSAFSLAPLADVPLPVDLLPCAIKDGEDPVVGTVEVRKQTAKVNARATKATIRKGTPARVVTSVERQDGTAATGKVVALVGGKQVAGKRLQGGKATLAVRRLGKGAKKIVVRYLGNGSTEAARKTVKVTVRK